jgi:hypothetical protein
MACGDRYRELAVTAGGLSFENPYDDVPGFSDFEEWRALADRLALLAQQFADRLGEIEGAKNDGNFPRWNAANEVKSRMVGALDDLPSAWLNFSPTENIAAAQAVVSDALCVIEMSVDGIVHYGGVPPPLPITPKPRENEDILPNVGKGFGWLLGAAVLVGGVLLIGRMRR